MPSTQSDRVDGFSTSMAVKVRCLYSTTGNISLQGLELQSGGDWPIALEDKTRILVQDQDDPVDNGIWVAGPGRWTRARDFDGNRDATQGTLVFVYAGTVRGRRAYHLTTPDPVVIGTSELEFELWPEVANTAELITNTREVASAIQTTVHDWIEGQHYNAVADFGLAADGTDNYARWNAMLDAVDAAGGGVIEFPPGIFCFSTAPTIGNGSNSQQSTKHHRIKIRGSGASVGSEVSNTEITGATTLKYTGAAGASTAALSLEGPLHSIGLEDLVIDANSLAGIGLNVNHVSNSIFRRVIIKRWTTNSYVLTTRDGLPFGCAYGNGDNLFDNCYAYNAGSNDASGVILTSGVNLATSLAGMPDSAKNHFIGGVYFYGGNAGTSGLYLQGADNNTFYGSQFYANGGSAGGDGIQFQQWPGSPQFPHENVFINVVAPRGVNAVGGASGTGGNKFLAYPTSDGAPVPTDANIHTETYDGRQYIGGSRAYRTRQISTASLNNSVQSTNSTSFTDVTGFSVVMTTKAASKLRVTFSGRGTKATAGTGDFVLSLNGSDQGATITSVGSTGAFQSVSMVTVIDIVAAGTQTVQVRFRSSDANNVQISHGVLVVEELY